MEKALNKTMKDTIFNKYVVIKYSNIIKQTTESRIIVKI